MENEIIDRFHALYYATAGCAYYRGVGCMKCPLDLWIYQEIIHRTKPTLIIETGTAYGGSAKFLRDTQKMALEDAALRGENYETGQVISIDVRDVWKQHELGLKGIRFITGSSADHDIAREVMHSWRGTRCMVILDSDHSKEHVSKELRIWSQFVTPEQYLIVEDTNLNGHPVGVDHGPGPLEAVEEFMKENSGFVSNLYCERFHMTYNKGGYLVKKS